MESARQLLLNVHPGPADTKSRTREVTIDSNRNKSGGLEADPETAQAFQGQKTEKVLGLHFGVSGLN
jgi:hypothetical protein